MQCLWLVGLSEEAVALDQGVKRQIAHLLKAFRIVMRVPLIVVNIVTIVFLLIAG